MNKTLMYAIAVVFAPFLFGPPASARTPLPVQFTSAIRPQPVHPGESAVVSVTAAIDPGWHLYSVVPTGAINGPRVTEIESAGRWKSLSPTSEDRPLTVVDPNFGMTVRLHEKMAVFTRVFRVPVGSKTGFQSVPVSLTYESCNNSICLPPVTARISLRADITSGSVRPAYATAPIMAPTEPLLQVAGVPVAPGSERSAAVKTGPFSFLLEALGAGFLALLTPCVFPLIPITLAGFVKQSDGDRTKLRRLTFGFALGIVALYLGLGGLVSLTLGASGADRLASNPWVNLLEFALFVLFALSFFDFITIQLPARLNTLHFAARNHGGSVGLVLLGVAFVMASFTCTAPFVGTLLVAAAGGERSRPLFGMAGFALAFASPFIFFGFSPGWIARIPRSGAWLARAKGVLGFIELAASLKFLSSADQVWQWKILTTPVLLALWAVIAILAAFYLLGTLRIGVLADSEGADRVTVARKAAALVFAAAALYCFWGISGRPIYPWLSAFLPPAGYGGADRATGLTWHSDLTSAAQEASSTGKPILIDFTGYTCTNCRLNERAVFPLPQIQQRLSHFSLAELYTDGGADGPANQKFELDRFGDVALPLYGVIDSKTGAVIASTAGVITPDRFAAFLDSALAQSEAQNAAPITAWRPYSTAAAAEAQTERKLVVIDFTADWCVNCKIIEKTDFTDPSVMPVLGTFTTLRSDLTDWGSTASTAIEQQYGIDSLPAVVILNRDGKELKSLRVTGRIPPKDFLRRLTAADRTLE